MLLNFPELLHVDNSVFASFNTNLITSLLIFLFYHRDSVSNIYLLSFQYERKS